MLSPLPPEPVVFQPGAVGFNGLPFVERDSPVVRLAGQPRGYRGLLIEVVIFGQGDHLLARGHSARDGAHAVGDFGGHGGGERQ